MKSIYAFRWGKMADRWIHAMSIVCFLVLASPFQAAAQRTESKTVIITGQVTDAQTKQPIPGVAIMLKASNVGVITDSEGNYYLGVNDPKAVLVASFLGYKTVEEAVNSRTKINFVLEMDSRSLEDVVVVGYGSQRKASVTGSLSLVEPEALSKVTTMSLANTLGGSMPGIITRQTSGEPGYDGAILNIRGMGTWGNSSPLVLVDGIERDLNLVNTAEIESFSILKDASATAVYGTRGANGVILINTKKGRMGQPKITLRMEATQLHGLRFPDYVNGYEFATLMNEACQVGEVALPWDDAALQKFNDGSDPYLYPNVDWTDAVLKKNTFQTMNNLSVSGGNETIRYYVNVGFSSQSGLFKEDPSFGYDTNSKAQRYNFRSNVDINLSKNFSIELGLGEIVEDRTYPGTPANDIFMTLKKYSPIASPIRNPDGSFGAGSTSYEWNNPYVLVTNSGFSKQFRSTTQGTLGAKWDLGTLITPGLSVQGRFSYDHYYFNEVTRNKQPETKKYLGPDPDTGEDRYNVIKDETAMGYRIASNASNRAYYYEFQINYNRTFGRHTVGVMGLFNRRDYKDLTAGTSTLNLPYRRQGWAGRFTYDFDHRYLVEFNFGYTGSENFAPGKRYGFFPAISAGWVLTGEKFWNIDFINHLKIRGSYGLAGNDNVGADRFFYLSTVDRNANSYPFGSGQIAQPGMAESMMGSPNATWEISHKTDVGLDLEMFNGAIRLQADYFYEYRDKILLKRAQIPDIMGAPWGNTPWANLGIVENRGFDGMIEASHTTSYGLYFALRGNVTYAHNTIIEDDTAEALWSYQNTRGTRVGQPFGYVALGLFQNQEEIDNSPKQELGAYTVGDVKYKDINGDGVINSYDRVPIGYARTPEIMYGFGGTIAYKGFDLTVNFTGAGRTSTFFDSEGMWPFQLDYPGYNVVHEYFDNRFIPGGDSEHNARAKYPVVHNGTSSNNYQTSTLYQRDASYIKLKTAEFGYNFPKRIYTKIGLGGLRVFVNGNNLLCFDKLKVIDPESNYGTGGYPTQRALTLGIQATF